ncbi:hypothetical protein [Flavobacterium sp.]|uniref:hypothetical protein n=1 Tax=Flavobacterium sp. TaxID=239 RepID=UPI001218E4F2|nr:hypothetical protein [Flavobacterium sp.]RZJ71273.1 MAG: hypothetical protein EOO49_11020 [Flavobacterium sp.]
MKKYVFSILLLLTFSIGFSQTEESLKARAEILFNATNKLDMVAIMKLTYNQAFKDFDKDALAESMKQAFDNEYMSITFKNPSPVPFTTTPIKSIDGKKFSVIRYRNKMILKLKQPFEKSAIDAMTTGLKQSENYEIVVYDEKTNSFNIEGKGVMIAVSDASTKGEWEFINYENKEMFNAVFGEKIKTELGL